MADADHRTVAVLGTGIMGAPMARNLAAAGLQVRAWNRTRERAEPLADDGVSVADSPAEAVAGAGVVLTMLADGDAVLATMDGGGAFAAMPSGAVWAQCSTVGLEGTERCAALAGERDDVALVDAQVVGTKQPAEQGALTLLASGASAAVQRCVPVFDAIGQRTVRAGDAVGDATRLKLVVNQWILTLVEGVGETVALAEGLGVDPHAWLDTIAGGPLDAGYAQTKGAAVIDRVFAPSFTATLARKDAELVAAACERHGLDLPLSRLVEERLGRAIELGHGDEDMIATYFAGAPHDV